MVIWPARAYKSLTRTKKNNSVATGKAAAIMFASRHLSSQVSSEKVVDIEGKGANGKDEVGDDVNTRGQMVVDSSVDLKSEPTYAMKMGSALFYSGASLAVIFVNKAIMTGYQFPFVGFMALVQFVGTICVLAMCHALKKVELPPLTWDIVRDIMPISIMFLGNILTGLGGTKNLNLPMFTCLRRFSILFTMLLEWSVLGMKPAGSTQFSVALMLGGSIIAALYDLEFDQQGYILVMGNNIFTALNGVYMKKAMISSSIKSNKLGVLFYNSLFSAVIMAALYLGEDLIARKHNSELAAVDILMDAASTHATDSEEENLVKTSTLMKITAFDGWASPEFIPIFIIASLLGSVLNYSIFLCTAYNSALTTAVIGCLKNVLTAYLGMILFSDFSYNVLNFLGINVSIAGSIYYTYCELLKKYRSKAAP